MTVVGKRVQIVGEHPHSGETGIADRYEKTALGSTGIVVKLDDSPLGIQECFVFKQDNLKFI